MAILTVHKTITIPESIEVWLKAQPNLNHSKLITELLINHIQLNGGQVTSENIDKLILAKQAELKMLLMRQGDVNAERELQDYFTSLPDEKKSAIIAFANNSGAPSYWQVVRRQRAFEHKYKLDTCFWLHGLTPSEYEQLDAVIL